MQFPVSLHIGNSTIPLHVVFEFAAFFIGFRYYLYLRKKQGDLISSSNRLWILIAVIFGALIGSRLVGGLEDISQLRLAQNKWLYFYNNKTVLGGFLGGLMAVELCKKVIGEKYSSGDLYTFPIILALIIGRIGCFTMGVHEETYGTPTTVLLAMNLGDGILRHPVTLYEIVFLIMLWASISMLDKKYSLANGAKFKLFLFSYCTFRLSLDFIKPHYSWPLGLSTIQIVALLGIAYYIILWLRNKRLIFE